MAPNGWISVDIGWIWVGYIQDGPLGPFGPTEIAPRSSIAMEDLGAISVGPNGPNGPSWMYPTQIQPISTDIQPFGATGASYGHKWAFYGIFGPFLTPVEAPWGNSGWSKWPQRTILDVSHPDPTNTRVDPAIWSHRSHLWP